jgi:hypothetical protein
MEYAPVGILAPILIRKCEEPNPVYDIIIEQDDGSALPQPGTFDADCAHSRIPGEFRLTKIQQRVRTVQ